MAKAQNRQIATRKLPNLTIRLGNFLFLYFRLYSSHNYYTESYIATKAELIEMVVYWTVCMTLSPVERYKKSHPIGATQILQMVSLKQSTITAKRENTFFDRKKLVNSFFLYIFVLCFRNTDIFIARIPCRITTSKRISRAFSTTSRVHIYCVLLHSG